MKIKLIVTLLFLSMITAGFAYSMTSNSNYQGEVVVAGVSYEAKELMLRSFTKTRFGEHWKNSIDGDLDGFNGTTLARMIKGVDPYVTYEFKDETIKEINAIRIFVDTGLRKRDRYFLTEFSLEVAGSDGEYYKVFDHTAKVGGYWQTYSFEPIEARYIKLILHQPNDKTWVQIGEFEVY